MPHPGKGKEVKAQIREELERGADPKEIAERSQIPLHTIRRWARNLTRYGSVDAPPQGSLSRNHKSLTTEMQTVGSKCVPSNKVRSLTSLQYLLGYIHGRPDASLAELRRVLQEAFGEDVSLPTLSRTLKSKGCMKGHNKKRDLHAATKNGEENASRSLSVTEVPAKPSTMEAGPLLTAIGRPNDAGIFFQQNSELNGASSRYSEDVGSTAFPIAQKSYQALVSPDDDADNRMQSIGGQTRAVTELCLYERSFCYRGQFQSANLQAVSRNMEIRPHEASRSSCITSVVVQVVWRPNPELAPRIAHHIQRRETEGSVGHKMLQQFNKSAAQALYTYRLA